MTFNLFGLVVIGSLWEANKLNKEYQRDDYSEGEKNNYVDGVTVNGTGLIPQTGEAVCMEKNGKVPHFSLYLQLQLKH